jgi:hypothetical protein
MNGMDGLGLTKTYTRRYVIQWRQYSSKPPLPIFFESSNLDGSHEGRSPSIYGHGPILGSQIHNGMHSNPLFHVREPLCSVSELGAVTSFHVSNPRHPANSSMYLAPAGKHRTCVPGRGGMIMACCTRSSPEALFFPIISPRCQREA